MRRITLGTVAALVASLAVPALAAGPHGGAAGGFHGASGFHGPASFHGAMPPHGFHGTPPTFHGSLPHAGKGPSIGGITAMHHRIGGPGNDLGRFNGRDFAHLTAQDRAAWQHGHWHHGWRHGHWGWWWGVGDFWFFYPEPIYPYPDYIGSAEYYDYYDEYGTPQYYWYHCDDPEGYYPYVQQCNGDWEPVPPVPSE